MKKIKIYLVAFILFLYFSFMLQGTNIIYNEQDNKENRNPIPPLMASSSLVHEWNRTWGGNDYESGTGVAVDSSGDVYLVGWTMSFGAGIGDMVMVKYDENGVKQWNRTWGGNDYDDGQGIAVDSLDNIYITGNTYSLGSGSSYMYLMKYDENGEQQWNRTWGGDGGVTNWGGTVDSLDNIYLVGEITSFGTGDYDMVLVKYDQNGVQQWNRTWGGNDYDFGTGVAVDSSGNIYLTGRSNSFGTGDYDVVLVKYDQNGVQQWNRTWGGNNDESSSGVAVDSSDNVYITGRGFGAMVLVKYDENGVQQWNRTWGGDFYESGEAVAVDSLDNIYLTGCTESFGAGSGDMVIVNYDQNGVQQWNATWGGTGAEFNFGVAVDSLNNVYLTGYTDSFGAGYWDVVLVKFGPDIYDPIITINNPEQNEVFGANAPDFNITIIDPNFDSTWYTIDNGAINITFNGLTGSINQTEWDKKSSFEEITITFYANDTSGNIGSKSVIIWKDLVAPKITINSPTSNQLCGVDAPTFSLSIVEPNIQLKRYSINGRPNITFTTQTQFSQTEWNNIGNGTASITFYIIDKAGNTNSSSVTVRKDANIPDITIISPIPSGTFGKTPPGFNISIIEDDVVVSMWYTVQGSITQYPITGLTGTIDQAVWNDALEGDIIITFYAQDRAGNVGTESVTVIKSIPAPPAIPGYDLLILCGIFFTALIWLIRKRNKP